MTAYYNENEPFKAEVLREAIRAGAIAPGDVDERSIADVGAGDLVGYTQCHFFAGGGFWSYALRLAGWPDEREVWTGSCPCPSFSAAGKGEGFRDARHLWPYWARLIAERRPAVVFGEQVSAAIGHGWLDLVCGDLEAEDYAVAAAVLGAHSVGAPHIRQRLYFVGVGLADTAGGGYVDGSKLALRMGQSKGAGFQERELQPGVCGETVGAPAREGLERGSDAGRMADADGGHAENRELQRSWEQRQQPQDGGVGCVAEPLHAEWGTLDVNGADGRDREATGRPQAHGVAGARSEVRGPDALYGFWTHADWIGCRDGKWRPVESGTFPLVNGSTARVGRLRLYGDAIVIPAAQAFIESYLEAESGR
jgi:DNA (cytosine-5)-methyltransferase 1